MCFSVIQWTTLTSVMLLSVLGKGNTPIMLSCLDNNVLSSTCTWMNRPFQVSSTKVFTSLATCIQVSCDVTPLFRSGKSICKYLFIIDVCKINEFTVSTETPFNSFVYILPNR